MLRGRELLRLWLRLNLLLVLQRRHGGMLLNRCDHSRWRRRLLLQRMIVLGGGLLLGVGGCGHPSGAGAALLMFQGQHAPHKRPEPLVAWILAGGAHWLSNWIRLRTRLLRFCLLQLLLFSCLRLLPLGCAHHWRRLKHCLRCKRQPLGYLPLARCLPLPSTRQRCGRR